MAELDWSINCSLRDRISMSKNDNSRPYVISNHCMMFFPSSDSIRFLGPLSLNLDNAVFIEIEKIPGTLNYQGNRIEEMRRSGPRALSTMQDLDRYRCWYDWIGS